MELKKETQSRLKEGVFFFTYISIPKILRAVYILKAMPFMSKSFFKMLKHLFSK